MGAPNIILLIERNGDELEFSVVSDNRPNDTQRDRRRAKNGDIKERKKKRKHHAGGSHADGNGHELSSGPHQTMILIDGKSDHVLFTCAQEFVIDVEFDPAYMDPEEKEPRRSPFKNWTTPQKGLLNTTTNLFEVFGEFLDIERKDANGNPINKTRPSDYQFYKCTAWSGDLKLDPDWYCDR